MAIKTHLPHPAAEHRVYASLIQILKYWETDKGVHRVVIQFLNNGKSRRNIDPETHKTLYDKDTNVGLFMSQNGRTSAIWMNEKFWQVTCRRWKKSGAFGGLLKMKIEVEPVELSKSHDKSLRKAVSKYL
jgi:hypothetical protein